MADLTPTDVGDVLDAYVAVKKRAQLEALEFRVLGDGDVEVVNTSHDDRDEHTFIVHVESRIPSDCECPAWEYQPCACKHVVAVANRKLVLEAVSGEQPVRADGGVTLEEFATTDDDEDGCCDDSDFPCFECYLEGRRELPGEGD
jgi:hypothetical protein